jgi:hypothetical protein
MEVLEYLFLEDNQLEEETSGTLYLKANQSYNLLTSKESYNTTNIVE